MTAKKRTTKKGAPRKRGAPSVAHTSRGRDGRFTKKPKPKAAPPVKKKRPAVAKEIHHGRAYYRNLDGSFAKKPRKAVPVAIGRGKRRRYVDVHPAEAKPTRAPKGAGKALKYELHGQSAPRMVEDNAIQERDTFIRWRGKVYAITPDKAGQVADTVRVLMSAYIDEFDGVLESPQFQVALYETSQGDLLDFDQMETMDAELADELADAGDDAAEEAALDFNRRASELLDTLLTQRARPHATKEARKAPGKSSQRGRPRGGDSPKGKGRKR